MSKTKEAISVLEAMGLPRAQQNERSGLTLLALADVKKSTPWSKAKKRAIRIHDILLFIQKRYGKTYAENTRETIRRQTLHQFEQAGLVVRNPDDPSRPTNSPNTTYTISDDALNTMRKYKTTSWKRSLNKFVKAKGKLVDKYEKRRKKHEVLAKLPDNTLIKFSPGKHNELQKSIIEVFRDYFCPKTSVLYVGDTSHKMLHLDESLLKKLKIPITKHDKLPDVVLYDAKKKHLMLVEAVTSHGPLSPKRQIELEKTLKNCKAKKIYVSAFPDFREFKKHIGDIAWDTEVWIADKPTHMVHFNGPKFFTVYGD